MTAMKGKAMAALAICALALTALGSAKNPVTRPMKFVGHLTIAINLTDGTWQSQDWGTSSHLGKFANHGAGPSFGIGGGTATAANGDQLFWVTPGATWDIEWFDGTGRFEHARGGVNWTPSMEPIVTYPDANTMVISYTYDADGVIKY
jgi:hypothetical protein